MSKKSLVASGSIAVTSHETDVPCYALRLSEEIVQRLYSGPVPPRLRVELLASGQASLLVDELERYPLSKAKETQVVDVVHSHPGSGIKVVGHVLEKLSMKQELVTKKMAEIRQVSEEAEKTRLARRTVTLDSTPISPVKIRKITGVVANLAPSNLMRRVTGLANRRAPPGPDLQEPSATRPSYQAPPKLCNGSASERDSQQSWSPVLADHGAHGAAPFCLDSFLDRSKKATPPSSTPVRRATASVPLLTQRPSSKATPTNRVTKRDQYHELEEQFGRRYQEYLAVSRKIDDRLGIFERLQEELTAARRGGIEEKSKSQLVFKVVIEEQRLKDDKEFGSDMDNLEECYAAMIVIKSRLASLVNSP